MLSDEEKKAIETLLNLIEKQSKEIEELKEKNRQSKMRIVQLENENENENIYLQFGEITEKKRWKDKIKAKIEEVKDGTYDAEIVLQSLLEKE